ncbi:hypothetical protein [Nocardia sp. X0981]
MAETQSGLVKLGMKMFGRLVFEHYPYEPLYFRDYARQDQRLLVFTPRPGTDAVGQLELLRVIGHQDLAAPANSSGDRPNP